MYYLCSIVSLLWKTQRYNVAPIGKIYWPLEFKDRDVIMVEARIESRVFRVIGVPEKNLGYSYIFTINEYVT